MIKIFITGPDYDIINQFAYEHFTSELKVPGIIEFSLKPSLKEIKGNVYQIYIVLPKELEEDKKEKWMEFHFELLNKEFQAILTEV